MGVVCTVLIVLLCVAAVACGLILFLLMPAHGCKEMKAVFYHRNLAHRGLHTADKSVPENSLAAFAAAAEAGYGIELDLQFSKDEQIVVFHDDDLKRVCGDEHRVDYYTYEELQQFSLCGTEQKIPLFSEVLKVVDGRVPLLVEFKNGPKNDLLCGKTLPLLRAYKGDFCIESFSPFIVGWFKKNAPDILRGQLSAPEKDLDGELSPFTSFMLSHCFSNFIARPHFIAYYKEKPYWSLFLAEKLGAVPVVWTVRSTDDIEFHQNRNDTVIFELYRPDIRY